MTRLKYFFALVVLLIILANTQIFSQVIFDKKDTIKITNKISKKHVHLATASDVIYLLPPDKSFKVDSARARVRFGLVSEKYDATMEFSFMVGMPSDANLLQRSKKILKYEVLKINDVNVKYFKLNPLNNESRINWFVFCENELFSFYGIVSYDIKHDKAISKNIEKSLRSIVVTRNPDVIPERNMGMSGDYALLSSSLGLKFVQRMSIPLAYFTEDGLPAAITKGSKILIMATPPDSRFDSLDIAEKALRDLNRVFRQYRANDTLIAERVQLEEFLTHDGVVIQGSLMSNPARNFIGIYATSHGHLPFFAILGICNEDEKDDFFEKIHKFKATVRSNY